MDDLQIIELYFARDEKAIIETDRKYGRLCFHIANNVLDSAEDSKECVNDTYLGVWNTIPPTRPENFMAFLCKVTRNLSLKRLEHNKAQKRTPAAMVSIDELENVLLDNAIKPDVDNQEIGRIISDFLRTKRPVVRAVFIRKYWFFDTVSDIAAKYSFTESKVKSMLYHTRNELRNCLRKEGIEI